MDAPQTARPTLSRVFLTFLAIGATAYGGVWASARRIERSVVTDRGWIDDAEFRSLLLVSTVIPAPKFVAMVALIGQRVRGLSGGLVAVVGLFVPTASIVLVAATVVPPDLLTGALAPLTATIGVAVVGLLFGNALHQWRTGERGRRNRIVGTGITVVMLGLMVLGAPLVAVAIGGFVLGPLLVRA
jgi:chromate transporter